MKTVLAIDFGKRYVGLAIAATPLVEPLATIDYTNQKELLEKLLFFIKQQQIEVIVFGVVNQMSRQRMYKFSQRIRPFFTGNIFFQDETLSTKEAQTKMNEIGKKKSQRKNKVHQFAACIILQQFLDDHPGFLLE